MRARLDSGPSCGLKCSQSPLPHVSGSRDFPLSSGTKDKQTTLLLIFIRLFLGHMCL
jgi:hypothetical protein